MRDKDDFGYDLTWLDDYVADYYSLTPEAGRNLMNDLAHRDAKLAEQGTDDDGLWRNLPFPVAHVGRMLRVIDEYQDELQRHHEHIGMNTRFLDAGCGTGTKPVMANLLYCYNAAGFDIRREHVEASIETARLFHDNRTKFFEQDAREFSSWADYEVIYLNRLMLSPNGQEALERTVHEQMLPGTYLIAVNNVTTPLGWAEVERFQYGAAVFRKPV